MRHVRRILSYTSRSFRFKYIYIYIYICIWYVLIKIFVYLIVRRKIIFSLLYPLPLFLFPFCLFSCLLSSSYDIHSIRHMYMYYFHFLFQLSSFIHQHMHLHMSLFSISFLSSFHPVYRYKLMLLHL